MTAQGNLIIRRLGREDGWEHDEKSSYNVEALRQEYRRRLYSEKELELLKDSGPHENKAQDRDYTS